MKLCEVCDLFYEDSRDRVCPLCGENARPKPRSPEPESEEHPCPYEKFDDVYGWLD